MALEIFSDDRNIYNFMLLDASAIALHHHVNNEQQNFLDDNSFNPESATNAFQHYFDHARQGLPVPFVFQRGSS